MAFYINTNQQDCSREISCSVKKMHSFLSPSLDRSCLSLYWNRSCHRRLSWSLCWSSAQFLLFSRNICLRNTCTACTCIKPLLTHARVLSRHPDSLIIAVDASLGQKKHLGYVTIANGALYPGAAVHKKLPPVGHIHITGIVNTAGMLEQLTLQTTRLSTVISIAEQISNGILLMIPQSDFRQTL